jgi:hypothetical protein
MWKKKIEVNDLLWQHWMIMSEDVRECFAFSASYECCEQFCFFVVLDPDHYEGTRSAFRDICIWSVKGI